MSLATFPETVQLFERAMVDYASRVDAERGVILGVRILGPKSANGYEYTPEAIREAPGLYEGIKVLYNHPPRSAPNAERVVDDVAGWLESVRVERGGLVGDLHLLLADPRAAKVLEAASKRPESFGLSHNASGRFGERNGRRVVEAILSVRSVDLVADPATTRGLFESKGIHMSTEEFARRLLESDGIDVPPLDPVDRIAAGDNAGDDADLRKLQRELLDMIQGAMTVDGLLRDLARLVNDKGLPTIEPDVEPSPESIDARAFASNLTEGASAGRRPADRRGAPSDGRTFAAALLG